MKEHPILMSGEMVRAYQAGRKRMTRRIVKFRGDTPKSVTAQGVVPYIGTGDQLMAALAREGVGCPYGQPGDRLWFRETFCLTNHGNPVYRADFCDKDGNKWPSIENDPKGVIWKPSIFLPRKFARYTPLITAVRVERLQDIDNTDLQDEGVTPDNYENSVDPWDDYYGKWQTPFMRLWEKINGPGSWEANPFVWAISFERFSNV